MKSLKISFLFVTLVGVIPSFAYRTYYLEDDCLPQKHLQKVVYNIPAAGSNSIGEIRTNRFGTYSRAGRSCLIKLIPPKDHGIVVTIQKIDFRNHKPCEDYIKLSSADDEGEKLCGYQENGAIGKSYFSDGKMKLFYHTENGGYGFNDGLRLIFTAAKSVGMSEECSSQKQFKCANLRCIWLGATCDGFNNCGDSSDESATGHSQCASVTSVTVAVIALAVTTLFAVMISICLFCCRNRRESEDKNKEWTDFPSRSNGGYIPVPGCTYSDQNVGASHPYHCAYPTAPLIKSNREVAPLYQQPSPLELPPPYQP